MAEITLLGVVDTDGIELLHPLREGRRSQQLGRKGVSNYRWIVGIKLGVLLNRWGLVVGWGWAPANTADIPFPVL
ncbi:MAG TPA: transposase, partial [Candidatus Competibacteraceae bacterium]|nr:transposase [Candidatus Competibacteraceae bacterium]